MKKRAFALLPALVLCLGLAALPAAAADYEVRYAAAAQALWRDGLFLGDGTSFALDQPLTRSAGITMLVRVLGKDAQAKAGSWTTPFTDVPAWAQPYVGYAYEHGLTSGTSDTTFSPDADMDATQFLTLVLRALGYDDKAGDFTYFQAPAKALEIGLIGQPCYVEYTTPGNLFRRDNAAQISWMALGLDLKGTSTTLKSTFTVPGQPAGSMPYATAAEAEAAKNPGSQTYPYTDSEGRIHYALYLNGTLHPELDAYAVPLYPTTVWLPIEYLARARGCTTSYDPSVKGGKLSIQVSSTQTYSYAVEDDSLEVTGGTAYIAQYGSVYELMGLTVEVDEKTGSVHVTGDLGSAPANWSSVGNPVPSGSGDPTPGTTPSGGGTWLNCSTCGGSGRVFCVSCAGMGQKSSSTMQYNPITGLWESRTSYTPCSACGGSGRALCTSCGGSGHR